MTSMVNASKGTGSAKLPVGISSFEFMRTQGYLYVDKTSWIYRMVTQGMYYFLSRPRRFGKSLLVSTLSNLFQGRKDLFEGLWIADHGDWDWQTHPVISLDFNEIPHETPEELKQGLTFALKNIAQSYQVSFETPLIGLQFQELIFSLHQKTEMPVAVLIDEYDKPMIDHLGKGDEHLAIAKANRDILKSFFGILKGINVSSRLRFVFLTGISRFSKVSIFSELNNLDDISMSDRYTELLGYTQEELETCFHEKIDQLAQKFGWSDEKTVSKLARQYNGYRFARKDVCVYNPFSILKAFSELDFGNYWFETGTPSFLIQLLTQRDYNLPEIEWLAMDHSMTAYSLEHVDPKVLLFQTGYVTIKDVRQSVYVLGYPNQEVKQAFLKHLLSARIDEEEQPIYSHIAQLAEYLKTEDFDAFFETMTTLFASIPYDIQTKRDEAYFHTLFYLMLSASGADAQSSVLTSKGRIDLAVLFPEKIYIIEFKCNQSPETAIQQIQQKGYAEKYQRSGKTLILIGINFSPETRNIAEWNVVHL